MLPVRVRPEALNDLVQAWEWYEERRGGLGDEFRACVDTAIGEIAQGPFIYPCVFGSIRRRILRRFPYAILFLVEIEHIEVLAVFHSARSPQNWMERIRG